MSSRISTYHTTERSLGWDLDQVTGFRTALLGFFRDSSRSLTWRENQDPYRILVSEVMLQQTRVETVIPYFTRWMERFPTMQSLAQAEEEEVLTLWAGLGYYSRARRLLQTVREIETRYDGVLPKEVEELETLPGIGPYTAGAIASIAFAAAVPAVDGNVRRVLSRITDVGAPSPRSLQAWAGELVDPTDPGAFNQALMELGSLVCLPRNPNCERCPVGHYCAAKKAGTQSLRPTPPRRRPPPLLHEAVAVLLSNRNGRSVLLRRRPTSGLLGGMWEFPGVEVSLSQENLEAMGTLGWKEVLKLAGDLFKEIGFVPSHRLTEEAVSLPHLDHIFSHKKVRYLPFLFRCEGVLSHTDGSGSAERTGELRWVDREEVTALPFPAAQRTLASRVWSL